MALTNWTEITADEYEDLRRTMEPRDVQRGSARRMASRGWQFYKQTAPDGTVRTICHHPSRPMGAPPPTYGRVEGRPKAIDTADRATAIVALKMEAQRLRGLAMPLGREETERRVTLRRTADQLDQLATDLTDGGARILRGTAAEWREWGS